MVDANVIKKYSKSVITNSQYDRLSIMHYHIPEQIVNDPSYATDYNYELSEMDKAFVKSYYSISKPKPKPPKEKPDNDVRTDRPMGGFNRFFRKVSNVFSNIF
jgi:hypothetical protein